MYTPFRRRVLCVLLLCSVFLILPSFHHLKMNASEHDPRVLSLSSVIPLNCSFNQKTISGCFLVETFGPVIPFEAIATPLELFGFVNSKAKSLHIHQADVNIPSGFPSEHDPTGQFMFFHRSDVEKRRHVKYISADIGVPISGQWNPNGHLYPVQIAQFGLSHFSKWTRLKRLLSNGSLSSTPLLDTDVDLTVSTDKVSHSTTSQSWVPLTSAEGDMFGFVFNASNHSSEVPERLALHILLHQENPLWRYFVLIGQKWHEGSFVQLLVSIPQTGQLEQKRLVYICSAAPNDGDAHDLSECMYARIWFSSNMFGLKVLDCLVVHSVELYAGVYGPDGGGVVSKLLLGKRPSHSALADKASPTPAELLFHECRFMAATRWLLRNQHVDGSWRTSVARHLHGRPTIKPGWVSAMAQGKLDSNSPFAHA
ncbi:uncharacterized protein DEA37_0003400 [Paragonimus westermani]|uniref:Hexosyltransferase n=1 Tax=Paragonimus westermani TaxID=34504 RepID=A0A5J4P0S8_9TREM|nr:uncharacterized protein DEA37_0003400 [Paragonimus westermani]